LRGLKLTPPSAEEAQRLIAAGNAAAAEQLKRYQHSSPREREDYEADA
jgi:hypothetical protein